MCLMSGPRPTAEDVSRQMVRQDDPFFPDEPLLTDEDEDHNQADGSDEDDCIVLTEEEGASDAS